jgi:CrcB protein
MIKNILIVGLGGGAGSMLRFGVQKIFQPQSTGSFPIGTFIVNLVGCFLIGVLGNWIIRTMNGNEELKQLLMTGFCGGFTTFSAFTIESTELLKENKTTLFLIYVSVSVLGGLFATLIGLRISK